MECMSGRGGTGKMHGAGRWKWQIWHRGARRGTIAEANLSQDLMIFSAVFPIYFLGKASGRVANGNHVIRGAATGHKSPLLSTLITVMLSQGLSEDFLFYLITTMVQNISRIVNYLHNLNNTFCNFVIYIPVKFLSQ